MGDPRPLLPSNLPGSAEGLEPARSDGTAASSPAGPLLNAARPRRAKRGRPARIPGAPWVPVADRSAEFLGRTEVARLLAVSRNTVTRWAREGRLAAQVTLGGHYRFYREHIELLQRCLHRAGGRSE